MLPCYVCPLSLASDLNWINVQDAEEAWKLLKVGRKNQSFASTHLNQNSSRRLGGRESQLFTVFEKRSSSTWSQRICGNFSLFPNFQS